MNSRIAVFIIFLFLPAFVFAQAERAKYVGYKYAGVVPSSTLPNGVKHLGGGLIGDINADPVYGISQVEKGRMKMLWLEASTGQDAGGVTGWQVKDVLVFSALARSDYLFFYGDPSIQCTRNTNEIANLVGVGRIVRRQGIFRPSKLWIGNLNTLKFEPLAVAGVKCVYSEP